jgi:hypothetical protein
MPQGPGELASRQVGPRVGGGLVQEVSPFPVTNEGVKSCILGFFAAPAVLQTRTSLHKS